jgi:hypothetical protein
MAPGSCPELSAANGSASTTKLAASDVDEMGAALHERQRPSEATLQSNRNEPAIMQKCVILSS